MYEKIFKRVIDFTLSLIALILLSPVLLIFTILGAIAMNGNPFFTQLRPGMKDKNGKERIFTLIKFRTMSNDCGSDGKLLPDKDRLGKYGTFIRSTSIDELPSLVNVIKGDLSICGPRPQLVRDMTFMTEEQRRRHDVRPGLTGLAQINGRNNISWEQKFEYDLQYIDSGITLAKDLKIIFKTAVQVLKRSDVVRDGTVSDLDFGDWLMQEGKITKEDYDKKQSDARQILRVTLDKQGVTVP